MKNRKLIKTEFIIESLESDLTNFSKNESSVSTEEIINEKLEYNLSKEENGMSEIIESINKYEDFLNNVTLSISKINNGINFEMAIGKEKPISACLEIQKEKSSDDTKYNVIAKLNEESFLELNCNYNGFTTDSIVEEANIKIKENKLTKLLNVKDISGKYTITKKFTQEFEKVEPLQDNLALVNNFNSAQDIQNVFDEVLIKTKQLNMRKMVNANILKNVNPFIYYIPTILPVVLNETLQNPEKNVAITENTTLANNTIADLMTSIFLMGYLDDYTYSADETVKQQNSLLSEYFGNGISGEDVNKLIENVRELNNTNEEHKIIVKLVKSNGKNKTFIDENTDTDVKFPEDIYYYVTVKKDENQYIQIIYIQQGQEKVKFNLLDDKYSGIIGQASEDSEILGKTEEAKVLNAIAEGKDKVMFEISKAKVDYYNKYYATNNEEPNENINNDMSLEIIKKVKKINTDEEDYTITVEDYTITVTSKNDPTKSTSVTINPETAQIGNWENNY